MPPAFTTRPCTDHHCTCPATRQPVRGSLHGGDYVDAQGRDHRPDGPSSETRDGCRYWHWHGRQHRTDGPCADYPEGHHYRDLLPRLPWCIAGDQVPAAVVIERWLTAHHPTHTTAELDLLVEVAANWPYGASLGELYPAIHAAAA